MPPEDSQIPYAQTLSMEFDYIAGLEIDNDGNIYVVAPDNPEVRRINTNGETTVVAGTGVQGLSGDGGPATRAQLSHPAGLVVDRDNNLYIADTDNNRVRRVGAD
jgi:sugar lactone lactonase YvrE